MKKTLILFLTMITVILTYAQLQAPNLKYDESYSFDKSNNFKMEIYAKNNELMSTKQVKTCYQSAGENFAVKFISEKKGQGMETVIDKKNEVAIQMFGTGGGATPTYNAGGYKYPEANDLKKLEIVPANETKQIIGYTCKKYTYTYKKIFGEVWITDQITLTNDIGVFRACKMAALHNTLSVPGFVMEMTTEDAGGGRTLMTTVSLQIDEKCVFDFKGVEMTKAMNKVNYYVF